MSTQSNPTWTLVDSSALSAVAYDAGTETLLVRFPNGTEYAYEHVTQSEHAGFATAGSAGKYFNQVIKPNHAVTRLGGALISVSAEGESNE